MKTRFLIVCIGLLFSLNLFSQSDEDLIRHTIHNYFNGTAFNYIDQIKAAFHPEAELYLENREGELMKVSAEEYISWFAKNEAGTFGGRFNKILSIEQEGNLAQVKAEIMYPSINRRYIDIFIMRRMKPDQWLIVSKAANSSLLEKE